MYAYPLAYWVHDLDPIAIHFPSGFFLPGIYWYGIAYMAGFVIAAWLLRSYARSGALLLNSDEQSDLLTVLIIGVLVGGRLGYMLLYAPDVFWRDPLSFFRIWESGMASHGGFIGVMLAIVYFSRKVKRPCLQIADAVATLAPPGFCLGRIANFINGELWGTVSKAPWAVVFPASAPYAGYPLEWIQPRHPSQLYEAALEGIMLTLWTQYRFRSKLEPGHVSSEFLMLYAVMRFGVEYWREPDAPLIMGLSRGQFYSLFIFMLGLGLKLRCLWLQRKA